MGAEVRLVKAGFGIGFKESWEQALRDIEAARRQAVRDPRGRLRPPARRARLRRLGARGRRSRSASSASFFDTIIVCSVTGSTQAGMVAGFALEERAAARASASTARRSPPRRTSRSRGSRGDTAGLIGVERELRDDEIVLDERYHAGTYGIPDATTLDAIRLAPGSRG